MSALVCGYTTEAGPCRHPVDRAGIRCWQHIDVVFTRDLNSAIVVDVEQPGEEPLTVFKYQDCLLVITDGGTQVHCRTHAGPAWEAAQALGGVPPCAQYGEQIQDALTIGSMSRLPAPLQRVAAHVLGQIPPGAVDQQGLVLPAYFEGMRTIAVAALQSWGAHPQDMDECRAVHWLETHGYTPTAWKSGHLGCSVPVARKLALVRAKITPVRLRQYQDSLPALIHINGEWKTSHNDRYDFTKAVGATLVKELMERVPISEIAAIRATGIHVRNPTPRSPVRTFVSALLAGLRVADYRRLAHGRTHVTEQDLRQWIEKAAA